MDIDRKKKLAEVMGWEVSYITPDTIINPNFKHKITKYPEGERVIMEDNSPKYYFSNWNPQENNNDFIEVIRALSFEQRIDVSFRLHMDATLGVPNDDDLEMLLWLIDNKDKVLDAVLEVVNND